MTPTPTPIPTRPRTLRRGLITASLLLALGTGCGTTTWTKPDFTPETWRRDHYTCQLQSRQAAAGFGDIFSQEVYAKKFFDQCLEVHGYTRH
jgi:hypothetical protein